MTRLNWIGHERLPVWWRQYDAPWNTGAPMTYEEREDGVYILEQIDKRWAVACWLSWETVEEMGWIARGKGSCAGQECPPVLRR